MPASRDAVWVAGMLLFGALCLLLGDYAVQLMVPADPMLPILLWIPRSIVRTLRRTRAAEVAGSTPGPYVQNASAVRFYATLSGLAMWFAVVSLGKLTGDADLALGPDPSPFAMPWWA